MLIDFFKGSDCLDYMVLRQLSHILPNWELSWDFENNKFEIEEDSYAEKLNDLLFELENVNVSDSYHNIEDSLVEYVIMTHNWNISKSGRRWINEDYKMILEQGGFGDNGILKLIHSAVGRIQIAKLKGQNHFDKMEDGHKKMLADILSIILYHKTYS